MENFLNQCLEYNKRRREKEEYQNLTYSGRTRTVDEETGRQKYQILKTGIW
jgi:hypothetical protein